MSSKRNKVNLYIPCQMDMFSPLVPKSVINVLEKIGDEVIYNQDQTCCGRRFYFEGEIESARALADKFIKEFDPLFPIVIPTTSCVAFIKNHYKELLENIAEVALLRNFTQNIFELCYYIVQQRKITCLNNTFPHRVFYFKSCSARNYYKLDNEPEILLKNTKGLDLFTDDSLSYCCGANGYFSYANPEVADRMLSKIIDIIYSQGIQYITSTDIECLQHIDAYLQSLEVKVNIEVIHISDILNSEE